MEINIQEISYKELNIERYKSTIDFIQRHNETTSDFVLSWLIEPLPIEASAKPKETEEILEKKRKYHLEKREKSLTFVKLIKKEIYDFLCTENEYYSKQRSSISSNINLLITSVSSAIAAKISNIETGVITAFVVNFFITLSKMGIRITCEYLKPVEQ